MEEMIPILEELRSALIDSGLQRTYHFLDTRGSDCGYYRKSLDLFTKEDYDKLKLLIEKSYEAIHG